MDEHYSSPRFICKSILRFETGWMVTFPDYENAGDNPFAVRETSRLMTDEDLLEWIPRRIERLTRRRPVENIELPASEVPNLPPAKRVRSSVKMKKLKCGHLMPRRKGVYPRRCPECVKKFEERVKEMRRRRDAQHHNGHPHV